MIKKFLQKIFKKISYGIFLKIYGKIEDTIEYEKDDRIKVKTISEQESLKYKDRDHALFVAFAPVNDPKYAISVVVEHGGSGSKAAAPIAKKVIKKVLDRHKLRKQYQMDLFQEV